MTAAESRLAFEVLEWNPCKVARASKPRRCERFRTEIPGAIVRAQQRTAAIVRMRACLCTLRIMLFFFSFSPARRASHAPSLSFSFSCYSIQSVLRRRGPLSSSIHAQIVSDDGVLTEITNSLVTNNFHSAIVGTELFRTDYDLTIAIVRTLSAISIDVFIYWSMWTAITIA